jgi:hypothetical protein
MVLGMWRLIGDPSKARRYESWSNSKAGFDATRGGFKIFCVNVLPQY